jgi:phosphoribosylformimino-5-aminoimidazole carboxamide ribotide isomerase
MEVIPAIDLRGGRCVRLYQGDYAREEIFGDDPVAVAMRWQSEGASRLHVVDLDGAASGSPVNVDAIRAIAASLEISIEVGGGIRDMETATLLAEAGADRLVLGTSAVEDPDLVTKMLERFGVDSVVVSVDAKDGWAALRGWKQPSQMRGGSGRWTFGVHGHQQRRYTDGTEL